jgi:2-amino-4-hydroxy-6-hydroxymethyldihydropteridine diphosphokinase
MSSSVNEDVIIALGSNLPGPYGSIGALLEASLDRLATGGFNLRRRSRWWRSASWPDRTSPEYLNGIVVVETALDPHAALGRLRAIEADFGRRRSEPNAPRTLDLDLIAWGRLVLATPDLSLPHPRAAERLFVMGPLAEIAPDWVHPTLGLTARALAQAARAGGDARPAEEDVGEDIAPAGGKP